MKVNAENRLSETSADMVTEKIAMTANSRMTRTCAPIKEMHTTTLLSQLPKIHMAFLKLASYIFSSLASLGFCTYARAIYNVIFIVRA